VKPDHLPSLESILWKYIPEGRERDEVSRLVYGAPSYAALTSTSTATENPEVRLAEKSAQQHHFDLPGVFKFLPTVEEQTRERKITRVAALQNAIVLPTDRSVMEQKHAIFDRIGIMIEAAAHSGANVLCLQVREATLCSV